LAEEQTKGKEKAPESNLDSVVIPSNFPQEMVFYFGSQTGTAEKFANVLGEEAQKLGVGNASVVDFEDFNEQAFLSHQLAVFVVATHYEGDPCDNTKRFFKWFKDQIKTPGNCSLKQMKYAVFGLGDSSYEQFNAIARMFDEGFEKMGAQRIYKYGEGNAESNSTEDDFNEWKKDFWGTITEHYKSLQTEEEKEHDAVDFVRKGSM